MKKTVKKITKEKFFSKRILIWSGILAAVSFIVYLPTLNYDFIQLDDGELITSWFKGAAFNNHDIAQVFKQTFSASFYRPVLALTVLWDEGRGGVVPSYYHMTNMLLFVVSVVLVYWFLVKLEINVQLAGWLTLIYAVHPLNAPTVAWIFGRNEPLLMIFLVLSLLSLKTYAEKNKIIMLMLHFFFYGVCLFTKETAIVIPVLAAGLLWTYFPDRIKKLIPLAFGWFAVTAVWFFCRQSVVKQFVNRDVIGWEAFIHNWKSLFSFAAKIFVPAKLQLNAYYDNSFIIGIIAMIILLIAVMMNKKNMKIKLFGFLWLVLFTLPPMFLISVKVDFDYALHRAFIPMIGVLIIIAKLLEEKNIQPKIINYVFGILTVVLLIVTEISLPVYKNAVSFWNNLPATYPERQDAYAVAGGVFFNIGLKNEADAVLTNGMNAPVRSSKLFYNLGVVASSKHEYSKAEEYYKKALEINPRDSLANTQLDQVKLILKDSIPANINRQK